MRFAKLVLAITAVLLIQTMVLSRFDWLKPVDLFLLLNIYFALNFDQISCMKVSVPSGLLQDAFSKGIYGLNAFSKTIIVFLISGLSSRLMLKHPLVIMVLIFFSTFVDLLILRGLQSIFNLQGFPLEPKMMGRTAILNSMIGIVSYQIADRIRLKKEYD